MIYRLSSEYFVRALREKDLSGSYTSWFEDQEVCRFNSHGKFPKNESYFRSFFESLNSENKLVWAICHESDGHIGNVSLQNISNIDRNAEFAIIIGDRRHWRMGVSVLASHTLLKHAFEKLNLEKIHCGMAAENSAMRKLATAMGMVEEGVRRRHLWLDGAWSDVVLFSVLRSEWREAQKA